MSETNPDAPIIVSYSEIDTHRQCAYKHQLSYKERWQKQPGVGSPLSRGTLFHAVEEAHYIGLLTGDYDHAKLVISGLLNLGGLQNIDQETVQWVFEGYLDHYGSDSQWKVLAVEYSNEIYLPHPNGGNSRYQVKVKIDLIVQDVMGRIWIIDHKTCKDLPNSKMLELDDQFGLYTWLLRQIGKKVYGSIHNACRTFRYKDPSRPYPMDDRFRRTLLYRTDKELDRIALEAFATAERAWGDVQPLAVTGDAERSPNTDTCNWKCDFTEPCMAARKGVDIRGADGMLRILGFQQNFTRH